MTNYGRRNKQEIGSKILEYINVKTDNGYVQSSGLIKRRKEENEYFNRPINRRPVYLEINHYDYSNPFISILSNILSIPNPNYIDERGITDIGIIYYDEETGNILRTICQSHNSNLIECMIYYPIKEGTYYIKLIQEGIFDNGDAILPFNLKEQMYNRTIQFNYETKEFEEIIEDKRIKIYDVNLQLPLYFENYHISFLYGNFFYYRGFISLYNKQEIIKNSYSLLVELSFCYLDNRCEIEDIYNRMQNF